MGCSVLAVAEVVDVLDDAVGLIGDVPEAMPVIWFTASSLSLLAQLFLK